MREKACDLVYLNTKTYISLKLLKFFYFGTIIIPIMMFVVWIVAKSIFPIVSIAIWTLLYWVFIFVIQSERVKKTFELRFLVNGITGLFISSLIWLFFTAFNIAADTPLFGWNFCLLALLLYWIFTAVYIAITLLLVHKGVCGKIRKKTQGKTAYIVTIVLMALFPSGILARRYRARLIREHLSVSTQITIIMVCVVLIMILCALGNINFLQYYYCKKYGINCDEHGNTTSPKLERGPSKSEIRKERKRALREYEMTAGGYRGVLTQPTESGSLEAEKNGAEAKAGEKQGKKRMPLILKILIGIVSVPILAFVITFIVFFIKAMIQDLS